MREVPYSRHVKFYPRLDRCLILAFIAFLMLAGRSFYLQILRGEEYRQLATSNAIKYIRTPALRGRIYDRRGILLADNRGAFDLVVVPKELGEGASLREKVAVLSGCLGMEPEQIEERLENVARNPYKSVTIKENLSFGELSCVEGNSWRLEGVSLLASPVRRYPNSSLASHVLGYLSEINPQELSEFGKESGYRPGDLIGRAGIEKDLEPRLRGEDGAMLVEAYSYGKPIIVSDKQGRLEVTVDHLGRSLRLLDEKVSRPGEDVTLTLDARLQAAAENALGRMADELREKFADAIPSGAFVVLDAESGGILALASYPTYDPNVFIPPADMGAVTRLNQDRSYPFWSRGLRSCQPPGSTFKFIVATAALEEGVIALGDTVFCPGEIKPFPKGRSFRCWKRGGHGAVSLLEAIAFSCDIYFYEVGLKVGPDRMAEYARRFGLGSRTQDELGGEVAGIVPDSTYKLNSDQYSHLSIYDRRWQPGETLVYAIGQGFLQATPIQMARATAAVVNGGYLVHPYLVRELRETPIDSYETKEETRIASRETIDIIREGMGAVINGLGNRQGTGWRLADLSLDLIGKTGTSQVIQSGPDETDDETTPWRWRDHAWFVAGVPNGSPPLALAVLMEHGGHGGETASTIARYFFEELGKTEIADVLQVASAAESSNAEGGSE